MNSVFFPFQQTEIVMWIVWEKCWYEVIVWKQMFFHTNRNEATANLCQKENSISLGRILVSFYRRHTCTSTSSFNVLHHLISSSLELRYVDVYSYCDTSHAVYWFDESISAVPQYPRWIFIALLIYFKIGRGNFILIKNFHSIYFWWKQYDISHVLLQPYKLYAHHKFNTYTESPYKKSEAKWISLNSLLGDFYLFLYHRHSSLILFLI